MDTIKTTTGDLVVRDARFAIVATRFNDFIVDSLLKGAVHCLRQHGADVPGVVIHCFTGTPDELATYLDAGFYIGITGWVCDERRGLPLREIVGEIPDDRLLIETDAPYLLPRTIRPKPRSRRNEPAYLTWVAEALAEIRGTTTAELAETTASNARRLFGIA